MYAFFYNLLFFHPTWWSFCGCIQLLFTYLQCWKLCSCMGCLKLFAHCSVGRLMVASITEVLLWISCTAIPTTSLLEFLSIYASVELLGHRTGLPSTLLCNSHLFSKVALPVFTPSSSDQECHCPTILSALDIVRLSNFCPSGVYAMMCAVLICIFHLLMTLSNFAECFGHSLL